jgi:hypothetical protein
MTTSRQTDWMNHPLLRKLVDEANAMTVAERMTLVKGLVPEIANEVSEREFDDFLSELRLKAARYREAKAHPGEGRATRVTPGEKR